MKSIPLSIECIFHKQRDKNIANQVSVILVAPTEKTLDIILKIPMVRTIQQFALKHVRFAWGCDHFETFRDSIPSPNWLCLFRLPFQSMKYMVSSPLTTSPINSMLWQPRPWRVKGLFSFYTSPSPTVLGMAWTDKTLSLITAQCNYVQNLLTTFNNIKYEPQMPLSCYQILVQDCTPELKFIVMLKNDNIEEKQLNIKIADMWVWCQKFKHTVRPNTKKILKPFLLCSGSDIDLFPKSGKIGVKVNGVEIPMENLPYQHPTGSCTPLSTNWHELLVFV